ncbi:MAG TPA: carboxyl transferase domain-containing protein, partial [bacterium]|nr:carboxyl transferase domain-containing protein [bacterium]
MSDRLETLLARREEAYRAGGEERVAKLHEAGKMLARERLDLLLDRGSFEELGFFVTHRATDFGMGHRKIIGDGVVSGFGRIDGRTVFFFAQDFS